MSKSLKRRVKAMRAWRRKGEGRYGGIGAGQVEDKIVCLEEHWMREKLKRAEKKCSVAHHHLAQTKHGKILQIK